MKICSYFGINDFVICLGYKGYLIKGLKNILLIIFCGGMLLGCLHGLTSEMIKHVHES